MRRVCRCLSVGGVGLLIGITLLRAGDVTKSGDDPAVERTRKQVRMLDDLYKTTVVLITETYVRSETDASAGMAAKNLFDAMKKKGHHDVRLLDATGQPYNEENVAKDEFEKQAIKALQTGKDYVDQIETKDGVRYLRAATAVPVVSKKCALCHPHFQDAKPGQAIGALSYKLRIE